MKHGDSPSFVTAWFKRHGIGYLDVLLVALHQRRTSGPAEPGTVLVEKKPQVGLMEAAGYGKSAASKLSFGRAVFLAPEEDQAIGRPDDLIAPDKWASVMDGVKPSPTATAWKEFEDGFSDLHKELRKLGAFPPVAWFKAKWPGHESAAWHVINEAPLRVQLDWYKEFSPLYLANKDIICIETLPGIADAEDVVSVTEAMRTWFGTQPPRPWLVNLWGTATSVQFGWHYLAWEKPAMKDATFIHCRTEAQTLGPRSRFRDITISVVGANPILRLQNPATKLHYSELRSATQARLTACVKHDDNFSILVLGQRGVGKTRAVEEALRAAWGTSKERPLVRANCGAFGDATHARSELFGHKKGSFTGAVDNRDGLLKQANKGALFLDEVHHLDRSTRGMLLTALQTDSEGKFRFTPLGAQEQEVSKFQPIFASNRPLAELEGLVEADFLDRISQRIVEIPPLADEELDQAWQDVWYAMKFMGTPAAGPPTDAQFLAWLHDVDRPGNFRDLERIAILVADHARAPMNKGDRLAWLKSQYGLRHQPALPAIESGIRVPFTSLEHEGRFISSARRAFAEHCSRVWGTQKAAVKALQKNGGKIQEATFSRWKNGKE